MLDKAKNAIALALFVCLTAGFVFAVYTSNEAQKSIDKNQRATAHKTAPEAHQIPSFPIVGLFFSNGLKEYAKYCNSYTDEEKKKWPQSYYCDFRITDFYLVAFTGLLFFATGTLGWYAVRNFGDSRILQRAYLNVLPAGIEPWVSDCEKLACDVFIVNAGNLPATRVSWKITCCLDRNPSFDPPEVLVDEKSTNIIAPKAKIRKSMYPPLEAERLVSFRAAIKPSPFCWLYVWGRIFYHDGFRDGRMIEFCHRYNLLGTENLSEDGLHIGARYGRQHEKGNRTDEG